MDKIGFYRNVLGKMKDNPNFTTPDVSLTEGTTLVNQLESTYIESRDGSHLAISKMREIEDSCSNYFRKLAYYVDRIAEGNESVIISSGFEVSKSASSYTKADFSVVHGSVSGSVKLSRKAVKNAKSYIWQLSKDTLPETEDMWKPADFSTRSSTEIENLPPGAKHWFRSAAITPDGVVEYTNPIMIIVV